jgi:collagen type VII alpha
VGVTGQDGSAGNTGATGQDGQVGITGATGISVTGSVGSTGETGSQGTSGLTGSTGSQGQGSTGATGVGVAGPTGAGGVLGYYGSFYDTTNQLATNPDTPYPLKLNTLDAAFGVNIANDGSGNPTHVVIENPGIYNIQFSAQLNQASGGTHTVLIWLRANGTDVPESTGIITIQGTSAQNIAAWNYFYRSTVPNEYIQLMFEVDNVAAYISTIPGTGVPDSPSLILTVHQVMNTQKGETGATGSQGSAGTTGSTGLLGVIPQGYGSIVVNGPTGSSNYYSSDILQVVAGASGDYIGIGGSLIPNISLSYSLGSTGYRWKEMYVGPGTLNIAGPIGSDAVGTVGTDSQGIVYTEFGFASPFLNIGAEQTLPLATGGWVIGATGNPADSSYDLVATQNTTDGSGTTGPTYSLIRRMGPTGSTGPSGVGATGTTGSAGPAGVTGATGQAGTNGAVGSTGITGQAGTNGAAGSTGVTGSAGITGATGQAGTNGIGITGPAGVTGATGVGSAGPTGAGGALGYYGAFWDSTNQTSAAGVNTPIKFNTTNGKRGVDIVNDGSGNPTRILLENPGTYNIQFSVQLFQATGATSMVTIWLTANGSTIVDSAGIETIQGTSAQNVSSWNYIYTSTAPNEYLQLYFMSNTGNVSLQNIAGSGSVPNSPSAIVTVQQVMNTQVGPTGTTGSAGTGIAGITGATGPIGTVRTYDSAFLSSNAIGTTGTTYLTIGPYSITSNALLTFSGFIFHPSGGGAHDYTLSLASNTTSTTIPIPGTSNITTLAAGTYGNVSCVYLDKGVSGTRYYSIQTIAGGPGILSNVNFVIDYL